MTLPRTRPTHTVFAFFLFVVAGVASAQNNRSGISLTFSGTEGTDWALEMPYHDPVVWDQYVCYIRDTTDITMALNSFASQTLETIRYKVDRDLNYDVDWSGGDATMATYSAPFAFEDLTYEDTAAVVGTTGAKPGWNFDETDKNDYYWRGTSAFGDEWHSIAVAHDTPIQTNDNEYNAHDGKFFVFVVNPKTPMLEVAEDTGEFYTTPAKYYFLPKIHARTTYFTGTVDFTVRDIMGNNISYEINAGGVVNAGASTAALDETDFSTGSNTLEYWVTSTPGTKASRTIVKDPTHPSLTETHGEMFFGGDAALEATFEDNRTNGSINDTWWDKLVSESQSNQLSTSYTMSGARQRPHGAAACALISRVLGNDAKKSGSYTRSYADFMREFLLMNITRIDPIGLEEHHNGAAIPSRDIRDRGYETLTSQGHMIDLPYAYDQMAYAFRSDQHADGMTPIEDYFLRDSMARWVMLCMLEIGGYQPHTPGMWGRCRFIGAQACAIAMPKYSTPYFGTCGIDGNTTVYTDLPFPTAGYTWKEVFIDESNPTPGYPDPKFTADFDGQWTGPGEYTSGMEILIGQGGWDDRRPYSYASLAGWGFGMLAMQSALHTSKDYPNFFKALERGKVGDLYSTKKNPGDPISEFGPITLRFGLTTNEKFPTNSDVHLAWSEVNTTSRGQWFTYGGPYQVAWFDATFEAGGVPPPPLEDLGRPRTRRVARQTVILSSQ